MPLKWIAFAAMIWIGGMVLGGLMEGDSMFSDNVRGMASGAAAPTSICSPTSWMGWLNSLIDIFLLRFTIFEGDYAIIRYLLLGPIIITMMFALVTTLVGFFSSLFRPV